MIELDLIPQDYRKIQQLRTVLKLFVAILIIAIASVASGKLMLDDRVELLGTSVFELQQKKQMSEIQQQTVNQLTVVADKMEADSQVLHGLRNGPTAVDIFQLIDQTYVEGAWFESLVFAREGELTDVKTAEEVNTGYFIIVRDPENANKEQAWRLNTHMRVSGHAINHTTLATLVNNLVGRTEVEDVKVLKTTSRRQAGGDVVSFDLVITINNHSSEDND